MPRKAFLADVAAAAEKNIPNIIDVKRGDDDGDVNFVFVPANGAPIAVGMLALGMSTSNAAPTLIPWRYSLFSTPPSSSLFLFSNFP